MKIPYLLLSFILGVSILSGCASENKSSDEKTTTNDSVEVQEEKDAKTNEKTEEEEEKPEVQADMTEKEFQGISFYYPNIFDEFDAGEQAVPTIGFANTDNTARIALSVETLPEEMTAKEYADIAYENLEITPESTEEFTINELEWVEVISNQNGLKVDQYITVIGKKAYIFAYSSSTYDQYIQDYKNVIESVQVIGQ